MCLGSLALAVVLVCVVLAASAARGARGDFTNNSHPPAGIISKKVISAAARRRRCASLPRMPSRATASSASVPSASAPPCSVDWSPRSRRPEEGEKREDGVNAREELLRRDADERRSNPKTSSEDGEARAEAVREPRRSERRAFSFSLFLSLQPEDASDKKTRARSRKKRTDIPLLLSRACPT